MKSTVFPLIILSLLSILLVPQRSAYAEINCYDCHGTREPVDYRPLDSSYRNFSTGGFQGNHLTHNVSSTDYAGCEKCHPGSSGYTSSHRDGVIKLAANINASPVAALYNNRTSAFPQSASPPLGTCSNVNCHFETRTPVWGTLGNPFNDYACNQCHGYPPLGTAPGYAGGALGSHDLTAHRDFTCDRCHTDHLSEENPFAHANDIGTKRIVVNPRDPLNVFYGSYSTVSIGDYLPSQAATHTFGNCKVSCHSTVQGGSDGRGEPVYGMPAWGTPPRIPGDGSTACAMNCHRVGNHTSKGAGDSEINIPIASGSHTKHLAGQVVPLGNCQFCHYMVNPPSVPRPAWEPSGTPYYDNLRTCVWCHIPHRPGDPPPSIVLPDLVRLHVDGSIGILLIPGATYGSSPTPTGKVPRTGYSSCGNTYCHSDGTPLATGTITANTSPVWGSGAMSCTGCHGMPPTYPNGNPKANSHAAHAVACNTCHFRTTSDGTSITDPLAHADQAYNVNAGPSVSFNYSYASSGGTCSSITCHGNGTATWGTTLGCDGCHDAPPATASHLKHFGGTAAQAAYGDTRSAKDIAPTPSAYLMNCGNCHPMDSTSHMNGVVEVELFNPQAPAGSLKKLNPASASYTADATVLTDSRGYPYSNGTCNNIYCHSYKSWTTPNGVTSPNPFAVPLDPLFCKPDVPVDLVVTRNYKSVTWGNPPLGCAGCHANPPQTKYPENAGGAGDSHSWISDPTGYDFNPDTGEFEGYGPVEFLHNNNMYFETGSSQPLSCMYCHNDTVRQQSTYRRVYTSSTIYANMSSVPIYDFSKHVNGTNDVAFEKQIPVPTVTGYAVWSDKKLSNATYDAGTQTCSNVACHLKRTNVKWGTPYKGGNEDNDCLRCHEDYYNGNECPDAASELSHVPAISSAPVTLAAQGYQYSYSVNAAAPSGGTLTYALTTFPEGMTISPTGVITWTPTALGSFPVTVQVNNGSLIAVQNYSISVVTPQPVITSTPVTTAVEGKAYSYRVIATVPSGVPAATYALTTFPTGMAINSTSGVISWTPTEAQVGSAEVTATATAAGYTSSQSFTITTDPSPITITSTPVLTATAGVQYRYTVTASMAGLATGFSFSLVTKPATPLMSIVTSTGLITWTPGTAQRGSSYPVVVKATKSGNSKLQSFSITVP